MPGFDSFGWMERHLLEQSPTCHWVLEADGGFVYAHGNTAPFFGKPATDLPGRRIAELFPEDAARNWLNRIAKAIAGETLVLRQNCGNSLFCVTWFPLRAPDSAAVYAASYARDITELASVEKELRDNTLRLLKAQESERGRLARFLHDEVGQSLSAAGLHLDLMRMDFRAAAPEIAPRITELQQILETIMAGVREYSYELNPDIVQRAGLHAAMDRLIGRARKNFSGNIRLMADSSLRFPPAAGSAVYKIAAEALQNALQHSGCSQIEVIIKSTPDGPTLEVRDNGKGFDTVELDGLHRGLGLLVMEHYAEEARLRLSVRSDGGKGTTVQAVLAERTAGGDQER